MVIASTSMMSEALFVPLSLGVISLALRYRHRADTWALGLCGLLLACAILTRPLGGVLVVPAALTALGPRPRRKVIPALLGAALTLGPCLAWEIRDVVVMRHVIPLTTQDGYLLAGTYNATSAHYAPQPGAWFVATQDPAMAHLVAAHPQAQEVALSNLLKDAATNYLGAHPGYVATVVAHNFMRIMDLSGSSFVTAAMHGEYGYGTTAGTADYVSTLAIIVLGAVGLFRRGARGWPVGVWLAPVLLLAFTLPVQGNARFRAPIDPYLVMLASAAVAGAPMPGSRAFAQVSGTRRQP
jgi:4-amino-4-deoxy-L-arabinose transferase-like glycosyltransferase